MASAAVLYSCAARLYREIGDRAGEADTLVGLGRVGIETGDYASADRDLRAALALYRRDGDQRGEDSVLFSMGELDLKAADTGMAGELFGTFGKAAVLVRLGRSALGSPDAGENFRKALAIARETADKDVEAAALAGLGHVALAAHEDQAAENYYRAALDLHRWADSRAGYRFGEAGALADMGDVARAFGNHEVACERWREALAIYLEIDTSFAAGGTGMGRAIVSSAVERIRAEMEQLYSE